MGDERFFSDAFNDAGFHCALYSHMMANGEPFMYEAVNFNTHVNVTGGWSYVDGFKAAHSFLKQTLQPRDVLLTLGAGDVWKVGMEVLKKI